MNGEELGGGSIRIHDMEIQEKIFQALGMSSQETEMKFGFFLKALEYGAPPHAGLALGMDRVIAMILNAPSIRDVIAFPKNRRAYCPLTHAPSIADNDQLDELGIAIGSGSTVQGRGTDSREGKTDEDIRKEKITREEVDHVAKLARLKLSDSEAEQYKGDLNSILDYVDTLRELNTDNVPPMSHVLDIKNVWRDDKPKKDKDTESLLKNAPSREKDFFKVPKILED
jgi:aspartyl-tRNA synthetase